MTATRQSVTLISQDGVFLTDGHRHTAWSRHVDLEWLMAQETVPSADASPSLAGGGCSAPGADSSSPTVVLPGRAGQLTRPPSGNVHAAGAANAQADGDGPFPDSDPEAANRAPQAEEPRPVPSSSTFLPNPGASLPPGGAPTLHSLPYSGESSSGAARRLTRTPLDVPGPGWASRAVGRAEREHLSQSPGGPLQAAAVLFADVTDRGVPFAAIVLRREFESQWLNEPLRTLFGRG